MGWRARLTNEMCIVIHGAVGTVWGLACWALQVDSALIPGFKAIGGEEHHTRALS